MLNNITGSAAAQPFTLTQAKALAMTALDIMYEPKLLETIQKEFRENEDIQNYKALQQQNGK